MTLLHSTVAGLEQDGSSGPADPAVAELKRSVVRAIADLELRKSDAAKMQGMEGATAVASVLASAGRAAYIVDPAALKVQEVQEQPHLQAAFAEAPEPTDGTEPLNS